MLVVCLLVPLALPAKAARAAAFVADDPGGNRQRQTTTPGPAGTPRAALQAGVIGYGYGYGFRVRG